MVLLTTTPQILSAISHLPVDSHLRSRSSNKSCSPSENDEDCRLPTTIEAPISHKTLISLSHALRSLPQARLSEEAPHLSFTLNTLLHNTRPYHALPKPPSPPSAEYLALRTRLVAEKEQREYDVLVGNRGDRQNHNRHNRHLSLQSLSSPSHSPSPSPLFEDDADDDISASLVLNILLSIVLCSLAVFHVSQRLELDRGGGGSRSSNRAGVRVLLSLGAGIVVGVAETVIYAAYLRKVKQARERERRRREVKKVMPISVSVGEDEKVRHVDGEAGRVEEGIDTTTGGQSGVKELIWGRGVNGGVRRRVRKRWEKEQGLEEKGLGH